MMVITQGSGQKRGRNQLDVDAPVSLEENLANFKFLAREHSSPLVLAIDPETSERSQGCQGSTFQNGYLEWGESCS